MTDHLGQSVCPTCGSSERHPNPNYCSDAWHKADVSLSVRSLVTDEMVQRALEAYYMGGPVGARLTIAFEQMRGAKLVVT